MNALTIREAADTAAIAAELGRWPRAGEIPPRDRIGPELLMDVRLPLGLDARQAVVRAALASWQDRLCRDLERYEDIRTRGLDAVSDHDLAIAYSGDPLAAVRGSLRLKANHISYDRAAVLWLLAEQARIEDALMAERPQLSLF